MRILYITQFFYPERAAAAIRAYDNAKLWTNSGNEVTIFTGNPNFPTGKIFEGYKNKLFYEENIEGIKVIRNKLSAKPNTNKIKRAIMYFSFPFYSIWNIIFNSKKIGKNYDVIISTSGTIFVPVIGRFFHKKTKLPHIVEIRDITFKQMLATSNKKGIGYKFIKYLELSLCKKADKIVTVTDGFKQDLIENGIESNKILIIPNGTILNDNTKAKQPANDFIISYFGTFGVSQNLTAVFDYIKQININNKKVKFILVGDGAEKQKLHNYIEQNSIENISIYDSMPQAELEEYYEKSDMCMVVLKNHESFKNTIPSKMFQIMGRKRPILFIGPKGEASYHIEKSKSGLILTGNFKQNSQKIKEYFDDEELYLKLENSSQNGFEYALQNFSRKKLAEKYIEELKKIVKQRNFYD